jgi:hypothetical protein
MDISFIKDIGGKIKPPFFVGIFAETKHNNLVFWYTKTPKGKQSKAAKIKTRQLFLYNQDKERARVITHNALTCQPIWASPPLASSGHIYPNTPEKCVHKIADPHFYMEVRNDIHKAVIITKPLDRVNAWLGG